MEVGISPEKDHQLIMLKGEEFRAPTLEILLLGVDPQVWQKGKWVKQFKLSLFKLGLSLVTLVLTKNNILSNKRL